MIRPVLDAVARLGRREAVMPWPVVLPPPEPLLLDDLMPVYDDYVPLGFPSMAVDLVDSLPCPRWPDALVFGPEYVRREPVSAPASYCPCGVGWAMGTAAACWCCGRPG